jgi:hypothetical protein
MLYPSALDIAAQATMRRPRLNNRPVVMCRMSAHCNGISECICCADNFEEPQQLCHVEESLRALVDASATSGWQLVNEGTQEKKKIG